MQTSMRTASSQPFRTQDVTGTVRGRWIYLSAVLVFTCYSAYVLTRPMDWLVAVIADDGLYYLKIARNLAATGVSTFDGVTVTNGYHPGWMLLMTACASVAETREGLVRLAVGTGLGLHLGASLLLIRVCDRSFGRFWAVVTGTCWLLNPLALMLAVLTLEAPLYVFVLVALMLALVRLFETPAGKRSRLRLMMVGVSIAACVLARTDAMILALLALAWVGIDECIAAPPGRRLRALASTLAMAGGVFGVLVAPWYLYSYSIVGTVVQDSAAMKMFWAANGPRRGVLEQVPHVWSFLWQKWFGNAAVYLVGFPFSLGDWVRTPAFFMSVAGLALGAWRSGRDPFARVVVLFVIAAVSTGCAYGLFLTDFQIWHFAQSALVMFIATFCALVWVVRGPVLGRSLRLQTTAAAVALGCTVAAFGSLSFRGTLYPWQREVYRMQPRFDTLVVSGARIGAFNAGVPAFFSDRTIVNLDGLVNHPVRAYWTSHRFEQFLVDYRIEYIADDHGALERAERFASSKIRLEPLASAPLTGQRQQMRWLWRVAGSTPRPSPRD